MPRGTSRATDNNLACDLLHYKIQGALVLDPRAPGSYWRWRVRQLVIINVQAATATATAALHTTAAAVVPRAAHLPRGCKCYTHGICHTCCRIRTGIALSNSGITSSGSCGDGGGGGGEALRALAHRAPAPVPQCAPRRGRQGRA